VTTQIIESPNTQTTDPEVQEDLSKKAHVISPAMNVEAWRLTSLFFPQPDTGLMVELATEMGIELVALCQYRWTPTERVGNHDVCGACMAIANNWIAEDEG
jgi:hypothetical protein